MTVNWHRPLAVAVAAALTAFLHGLLLIGYLNRPAPEVVTEAVPLPMIDIALTSPNPGAPAQEAAPPVPPKPVVKPPEKKPKPKVIPKPKVKPKVKSEVKKPLIKTVDKPAEVAPETALTNPPSLTKTTAAAPDVSQAKSAPIAKDVPANANADYLNNPKPAYPHVARQRHWEGRVVLRVYVTAEGRCGDLSVYRSSGHEALDDSALAAVRNWRFVPGKHGDTAVASWVNVPIEFALE